MKPRRSAAIVGPFAAAAGALAFVSGCANPRGTASTLSQLRPVSSPAASSPAASSPVASSSSAASTRIVDSTQINGAVTADSERELLVGYVGGDFHTDHEWIDLTSVTPRLYLFTRLLMEVGAHPPVKSAPH